MSKSRDLQEARTECQRLADQYEVWLHSVSGKLIWPAIDLLRPLRILDSAGANGCWTDILRHSMSEQVSRESDFVVADFDPLLLELGRRMHPSSVQLLEHNILDPWPQEMNDRFDVVQQRLVMAVVPQQQIATTLLQYQSLLRPGQGWLQLIELDTSPDAAAGPALEDYKYLLNLMTTKWGGRQHFAAGLEADMRKAGYVDVEEHIVRVPLGLVLEGNEQVAEMSVKSVVSFAERLGYIAAKFKDGEPDQRLADLSKRLDQELRRVGGHLTFRVVVGRRAV